MISIVSGVPVHWMTLHLLMAPLQSLLEKRERQLLPIVCLPSSNQDRVPRGLAQGYSYTGELDASFSRSSSSDGGTVSVLVDT